VRELGHLVHEWVLIVLLAVLWMVGLTFNLGKNVKADKQKAVVLLLCDFL